MKERLESDKIEINWNKNPIKMKDFLKFLTVDTVKSTSHLGYYNGWTQRVNKENMLVVQGGMINGVEYLDRLEYGKKMQSKYNNFVNPFYLFDILTKEGKSFFYDYYKDDIAKIIKDQNYLISSLTKKRAKEVETLEKYEAFQWRIKAITNRCPKL